MATNLNRVCVSGNLTKDPELRSLPSGSSLCSLRIAVNDRRKMGEEWQDVTGYYDVTLFGKSAENAAKFLNKGRGVIADGRLSYREWESDAGKRSAVEIIADNLVWLPGKDGPAPSSDDDASFD